MRYFKFNSLCFVEDCDAAHLEVVGQIEEAHAELKKRGFKMPAERKA